VFSINKQKFIVLHNEKLIKLRNNFRLVLLYQYYDQLSYLEARGQAESVEENIRYLRQAENLHERFDSSIVVCAICHDIEGDRYYLPRHNAWYCKACYIKGLIPKNY
jgi:hypothetical protein